MFESGLGSDWTPWEQVARQVSVRARTFAYSRPGYGASEPSPDPRDGEHIVADLRALLAARGLSPPYVLVGHSSGGAYMELFAKAHPEEVAGVVLVDPRHRDFESACEQAHIDGCVVPASVIETLPEVQVRELEGFARTFDAIRDFPRFGDYPVRVLTATSHTFGPEAEQLWESLLGSLASEAEDGHQILFPGVGHGLQVERPHDVAEAILNLLPSKD